MYCSARREGEPESEVDEAAAAGKIRQTAISPSPSPSPGEEGKRLHERKGTISKNWIRIEGFNVKYLITIIVGKIGPTL